MKPVGIRRTETKPERSPRADLSRVIVERFARQFVGGNAARRCVIGAFLLGKLTVAVAFAQTPSAVTTVTSSAAPAVNWVLPIFTDKEGFRSMTLRGSEVRPAGKSIAVTDLSITIFSGDAQARVDTILLSPAAVFSMKENRASGDTPVRLIRDDIEVTGVGWTYDHAAKKVSLQKKVRVTFRAQMNDILK